MSMRARCLEVSSNQLPRNNGLLTECLFRGFIAGHLLWSRQSPCNQLFHGNDFAGGATTTHDDNHI